MLRPIALIFALLLASPVQADGYLPNDDPNIPMVVVNQPGFVSPSFEYQLYKMGYGYCIREMEKITCDFMNETQKARVETARAAFCKTQPSHEYCTN